MSEEKKFGIQTRELSNLFIWSAFKYYLRNPEDSYIIFSPIKYWKNVGLAEKEYIDGFVFNRKHFHATSSSIGCILWGNKPSHHEVLNLPAFDIENEKLKFQQKFVTKVSSLFMTKEFYLKI